ncbi:MAG TPA: hypothetical protein VKC15_16590 [Gemmatimonadales bacterium]|nr:hypothetical protein [Gemmatimonadales bacterium]
MRRGVVMAALAILVGVGLSCGGKDGTGPVAGDLKVQLTSPNSGADSAIVFTITSPAPLTSATPGAGLRLFAQPLGGTATRFVLVGRLFTSTTILTIGVADVNAVGQYSGSIGGVAQPNYALRALLPGTYALSVIR